MTTKDLITGFGEVDDRLVRELENMTIQKKKEQKRKREKIIRTAGICLSTAAVILVIIVISGNTRQKFGMPLRSGYSQIIEPETEVPRSDEEKEESPLWTKAQAMVRSDQLIYRGSDGCIDLLPLLPEDDPERIETPWITPAREETLGSSLIFTEDESGSWLFFTRMEGNTWQICRKSLVTQVEENMLTVEAPYELSYKDNDGIPHERYFDVKLMAAGPGKLLYAAGDQLLYEYTPYLLDIDTGENISLCKEEQVIYTLENIAEAGGHVYYIFNGGRHDSGTYRLLAVREDGEIELDCQTINETFYQNGNLYFSDDPINHSDQDQSNICILNFENRTIVDWFCKDNSFLRTRIFSGLLVDWDEQGSSVTARPVADIDCKPLSLPVSGNTSRLDTFFCQIDNMACMIWQGKLYCVDPEKGVLEELLSLPEDNFYAPQTTWNYDKETGLLVCAQISEEYFNGTKWYPEHIDEKTIHLWQLQ